jgi:hypothetical protein
VAFFFVDELFNLHVQLRVWNDASYRDMIRELQKASEPVATIIAQHGLLSIDTSTDPSRPRLFYRLDGKWLCRVIRY